MDSDPETAARLLAARLLGKGSCKACGAAVDLRRMKLTADGWTICEECNNAGKWRELNMTFLPTDHEYNRWW